jgi:head-tail adaptor
MSAEFAGALNQRVVIEQRAKGRSATGGTFRQWDYVGAAWAAVSPIIPAGLVAGDTLSSALRWKVSLRKREDIAPGHRLVWNGRFLMIRAVVSDPAEPSRFILTCEEAR